jgi:hypothetical protein
MIVVLEACALATILQYNLFTVLHRSCSPTDTTRTSLIGLVLTGDCYLRGTFNALALWNGIVHLRVATGVKANYVAMKDNMRLEKRVQ